MKLPFFWDVAYENLINIKYFSDFLIFSKKKSGFFYLQNFANFYGQISPMLMRFCKRSILPPARYL